MGILPQLSPEHLPCCPSRLPSGLRLLDVGPTPPGAKCEFLLPDRNPAILCRVPRQQIEEKLSRGPQQVPVLRPLSRARPERPQRRQASPHHPCLKPEGKALIKTGYHQREVFPRRRLSGPPEPMPSDVFNHRVDGGGLGLGPVAEQVDIMGQMILHNAT